MRIDAFPCLLQVTATALQDFCIWVFNAINQRQGTFMTNEEAIK